MLEQPKLPPVSKLFSLLHFISRTAQQGIPKINTHAGQSKRGIHTTLITVSCCHSMLLPVTISFSFAGGFCLLACFVCLWQHRQTCDPSASASRVLEWWGPISSKGCTHRMTHGLCKYICYFPHPCPWIPTRQHLMEEGFILTHSLGRDSFHHGGEGRVAGWGGSDHVFVVRE